MGNLKIICDSLSDIPKELREKYDIEMVSLTVRFRDNEYKDGVDLTSKEFYDMLRNSDEPPKTSQATYVTFKEVFEKYVNEGKDILYIAGSSKATGTYQSAVLAKGDIEGTIYTFDTQNFSYGCGMQVVKAAQMAQEGASIDEIMKELEYMRDHVYCAFSVDSLKHLQRGGRISSTKAAIGTMLNIKPILEVKDGLVAPVAQVRGKKNVVGKIVELAKENCGSDLSDQVIAIGHGDVESEMLKLKELAQETFNPKDIIVTDVGTSVGAHAGPGIMGIFCIKK